MKALTSADAEWMAALHRQSFPKGWNAAQFLELLAAGAHGWKVDNIAFLLIRSAADEVEIITLATTPNQRRQGHAITLLHHAIAELKTQSFASMFLEVRDNNEEAIRLYRKLGFTHTATRPNYYGLPDGSRRNALVMQLALA